MPPSKRPVFRVTSAYTYIREERQVKVKKGGKVDKGDMEKI